MWFIRTTSRSSIVTPILFSTFTKLAFLLSPSHSAYSWQRDRSVFPGLLYCMRCEPIPLEPILYLSNCKISYFPYTPSTNQLQLLYQSVRHSSTAGIKSRTNPNIILHLYSSLDILSILELNPKPYTYLNY